jgi:hypothetical protein
MKYALFGYTYQHEIALFLLAKMDVEREIEQFTQEAKVSHQFDDVHLTMNGQQYFLQIKDFEQAALTDLQIQGDELLIKNVAHRLSADTNIVFFKQIDYIANSTILGFPAYEFSGVYVVSLNRTDIEQQLNRLYRKDPHRRAVIEQLLAERLDKRELSFEKNRLPAISFYNTRLAERTVKISRKLLAFKNILFIEGKPGVGKSHLAKTLQEKLGRTLIYRFWVSNQDAQYDERLKYGNFLTDLSKQLFNDYKDHSDKEIFDALKTSGRTLLIDGLDHVENYNPGELQHFIDFLDQVNLYCKTIVFSRPVQFRIKWKKQILANWNEKQTFKVLKVMYGITDFTVTDRIYKLTGGYPILVRYVSQQYKLDGKIPEGTRFDSVTQYYDQLLKNEKGQQGLALFLCCRGFLMESELPLFLDTYPLSFVKEFILQHPYLFEIRINRISLFHDSLLTYLRLSDINYSGLMEKVNTTVYHSLMTGEKRFQSRVGHFDFSVDQVRDILRWYASMKHFKQFIKDVVDFEAVRELYEQLRELLLRLKPNDLALSAYYDLVLLINTTQRRFIADHKPFQYTYSRVLAFNGYTEEDITSNKYLFAMWYYVQTKDASLLLNISSDDNRDTADFYNRLDNELSKENTFFEFQQTPFRRNKIRQVLQDTSSPRYRDNLVYLLINVYLHKTNRKAFPGLFEAIKLYLNGKETQGKQKLELTLASSSMTERHCFYALEDAKKDLLAYGVHPAKNDYVKFSLKQYLIKHGTKGNFTLWPELLSYLRLSLHLGKKIDLASIAAYWPKYHQRHDYTLGSIDQALSVFEQCGWVDWRASVQLIGHIQEQSEKGYRGFMASYLMEHEPEFILQVLDKFTPKSLNISWFDLTPTWLNILPDDIYARELQRLFNYHSTNRQIELRDIENLLGSNKLNLLQRDLRTYGFKIAVKHQDAKITELERLNISYAEHQPDPYDSSDTPEESFAKGILDDDSAGLITINKLSPAQVAAYHNGYYSVLAEPALFRLFPKRRIRQDIRKIIFSALTAKSRQGEYFQDVNHMPGTILTIMADCGIPVPKQMYYSFNNYFTIVADRT